jgi:hypothetical protein
VVLDQLFACSMPVTFAEQDKTCTPSEVAQSESLVERLSNNGDNFRSVLDNMMDLIKYTCKDETEEGGVSRPSTASELYAFDYNPAIRIVGVSETYCRQYH